MNHSVHEGKPALQAKHWRGEYFGSNGAIEDSLRAYNRANMDYIRCYDDEHKKEYLKALMGYLSTLYSALHHSICQVMKFKLTYVQYVFEIIDELNDNLMFALEHREALDAGQKEVLMAVLLSMRFVPPFPEGYRKLAIELGKEIVTGYVSGRMSGRGEVFISTYLLACARLSRVLKGHEARAYRDNVLTYINIRNIQRKLGWKTINRLARMVGDKKLVHESAILDGSPDIKLKSGM